MNPCVCGHPHGHHWPELCVHRGCTCVAYQGDNGTDQDTNPPSGEPLRADHYRGIYRNGRAQNTIADHYGDDKATSHAMTSGGAP